MNCISYMSHYTVCDITSLCQIAKTVVCRYPKPGERIDYREIVDLSVLKTVLTRKDFLCDCTGVTWILLLLYYLKHELKPAVKKSLEEHIIRQLPDPKFHLYFPREYYENEVGAIYYLKYQPFYVLKEYFDSGLIRLTTNNMGWWCICVGNMDNLNQEEISELCIDPIDKSEPQVDKSEPQVDKSEPLYLCYWGKRPGTDCSMGIVTYEELSKRLIQDAKRDWGQHLDGLETMTKNSTQGLLECNLKIKNLNLESVEFMKLGSVYQPNSNSNLDVGNFYQNKAINLTPSEKYIKTNLI